MGSSKRSGMAAIDSSLITVWLLFCIIAASATNPIPLQGLSEMRKLKVGTELFWEQLPLQSGSCIYEVEGLEPSKWYEVKISYPASIPATFKIELLRDGSFRFSAGGRLLLNTEKLIFKALANEDDRVTEEVPLTLVHITVEPAGILTKQDVKDQPFIIYNILCEGVQYGIPSQAWWIGFLALIAVILSAILPAFLPSQLLPRKCMEGSLKQAS
eukprot:c19148_g1_i1 orf=45-686(+)